jgi:hypothetical protein
MTERVANRMADTPPFYVMALLQQANSQYAAVVAFASETRLEWERRRAEAENHYLRFAYTISIARMEQAIARLQNFINGDYDGN